MTYLIYAMIYFGSALMVFNIWGFVRFARKVSAGKGWETENKILYIPIVLLVMFLLGYLAVGIFGKPDLIVSGILFGGSIFVYVMYRLLERITERISLNKELEARLMATEETSRAKTEFLSGVSHEMRTPMNVILGLNTMAMSDPGISSQTKGRLEKIGASANHLLSLINNILDLNSIDTGEFMLKDEEFLLDDAVWQLNAIAETLCREKGLEYSCTVDEKARGKYSGDEMRLSQVIMNLLDNASKYTDAPGSVTMKVEGLEDEEGADLLRFEVSDTGIGITPEFLPKVFDVFSKEDPSVTGNRAGSGIGLSVTKSIVDLIGGTIIAQSEKGVGSTFTVTLPVKRIRSEEAPCDDVSLEGRRILIAEDIPENAEIVADLLDLEGALTEHAENGRIAVEMFSKNEPGYYDAILMDLRMPEMDGLSATREIRKSDRADAKTIPIIALTANAFESDIRESLNAGMNIHLAKPADADKLYSALRKVLSAK
ncbi:MAG: response regulator [Clostridia bacterium]|nr:response regulator [Clostridia bacterium]